jgi:uncharacterized phosphosugar-binding protein
MPQDKKYYKNVITFTVLTEEPIPDDMDLEAINYEVESGSWSGAWSVTSADEVSGAKMARLLIEQGSDPSFFSLNADGSESSDA